MDNRKNYAEPNFDGFGFNGETAVMVMENLLTGVTDLDYLGKALTGS